jgi:hypothetical protein
MVLKKLTGAAGNIIGGLTGGLFGGAGDSGAGENAAAMEALRRSQQLYQDVDLPDYEKLLIDPRFYEYAGDLSPELQDSSAALQLQDDEAVSQARRQALLKMLQASETGATDQELQSLRTLLGQPSVDAQARQATLQASLAEQGGLTDDVRRAMMETQAQQANTSRRSASNEMIKNLLQGQESAIRSSSDMGMLAREGDLFRKSTIADQEDAIARRNLEARNITNIGNVEARQKIAGANVDLSNEAQRTNKALEQQKFSDNMSKITGANQAGTALQNFQMDRARNLADASSAVQTGTGQAIGSLAGALGSYYTQEQDKKKNKG